MTLIASVFRGLGDRSEWTEIDLPPRLPPRTQPGPKVTVVMPTFNRAHVIGGAIQCILTGEWSDLELVVQDDGDGRDGTPEAVAAAAAGDPRVRYFRNERRLGIPGNLNAAIANSRGDLIAMCHDHDIYKPTFLRRMVEVLERNPSALFVHCAIDCITQEGKYVQTLSADWPELTLGMDWLRFMLSTNSCPVCALTLVRRSAHQQHGLYDPRNDFVSDIELWMRLSSKGDVAYIRESLIQVREREANHYATANAQKLVAHTADIHRRYLPRVYTGIELALRSASLELRTARQLANLKASVIKHQFRRVLEAAARR